MDTQAAYEQAYAELGTGVEEQINSCGCGGACAVCQPLIAQARRRAEELISEEAEWPR